MAKQVDQLLVGGTIVTMDSAYHVVPNGAVAIQGDSLVEIGPAETLRDNYTAEEIVDCSGQVIIPGLVNAHTHVPMTLLRGLNDDLRLPVFADAYKGAALLINQRPAGYVSFVAHAGRDLMNRLASTVAGIKSTACKRNWQR